MRTLQGALATAGAAAMLAAGLAVVPASARVTTPVMQAQVTGWSGMVRHPYNIYIGMGGSPIAKGLTWSRWTTTSGKATGKIYLYWTYPSSSAKPSIHPVTVWVNTPKIHRGTPYFAHMIYRYVNAKGVTKYMYFRFYVLPGASVPGWNPSSS